MSRKLKVTESSNLSEMAKVGDVIEITFLPLSKYKYNKNGDLEPSINVNEIPQITKETKKYKVSDIDGDSIDVISFDGDTEEIFQFNNNQITHIKVIEKSKRDYASFGSSLEIEYYGDSEEIEINGEYIDDSKFFIASIIKDLGWTMSGGDAKEFFESNYTCDEINGNTWSLGHYGFGCGCVSCSTEELYEALEWITEKFGWTDWSFNY